MSRWECKCELEDSCPSGVSEVERFMQSTKEEKYEDEEDDEGRYSADFSKWYRYYINRKYITDDKRKVFHSFRHTTAQRLIDADVRGEHIAEILGHTQDLQMTFTRYGDGVPPKLLQEAVKKIDFSDIANLQDVIASIKKAVTDR